MTFATSGNSLATCSNALFSFATSNNEYPILLANTDLLIISPLPL